jgi:hypothetical protein
MKSMDALLRPRNYLKAGEKHRTSPSFCICLCSKPFSLQSPCNHLGIKEGQEWLITSSWQGTNTVSNSIPSIGCTTCLTPDNNWNVSENKDWDNDQQEHTCDWKCLIIHTFCPLPPVICLLKPISNVCTLKIAEDELRTYFASSQGMSPAV